MMLTITSNRKVLEKLTLALENIHKYNTIHDMAFLKQAETILEEVRGEDPNNLDAIFYLGMTMDLIGKPVDAPPFFERILNESQDEHIKEEALYNLSVSLYHQYSHEPLEKAEEKFKELIDRTKNDVLKNLARATLAQTYAMWMIPNSDQIKNLNNEKGKIEVFEHIQKKFDSFKECETEVRKAIKKSRKIFKKKSESWKKVQAIIDNARGMALMYYTDYLCDTDDSKLEYLKESLEYLESSDRIIPKDWANTCDLGSVHMRMSIYKSDHDTRQSEFNKAKELLTHVVKELRPDYGFSLYELGRLHRLHGYYDESVSYFEKSLSIPEQYRDVSNKTVKRERDRARAKESCFP
jgi:tetratricopeptide (TPR) repeat protein